jgi:phage protein D
MTEPLFASTAPIFQVDGEIKGELARDLLRLEVEEDTGGMKRLSARFLAQGPQPGEAQEQLLYLDGRILDFGKRLQVSIGPAQVARIVFDGPLSAIEAVFREGREPEVLAFAEDRLMDLRMTRRMKTYENMSDADIAREIAGQHGLSAQVDADGPTYDRVQQWNQSDLAFLRERARLIRAEVWLQDDSLHFASRASRNGTELTLVQGNHIVALSARADLAHQRTKVKVSGYDAQARDRIDEEAGEDAIQAEVSGGRTGPAVLQRAFGERVSYRVREVPLTGGEARDFARAEMLRRARGFVAVHGVTRGSPDMIVGSRLRLERVGAPFEGDGYYVTHVCHTYDLQEGHRTRFQAERATISE